LGIPFRKVNLIKSTLPWQNPVADALSYAKKNLGRYESDRSVTRGATTAERWIAPEDLIAQMAEGLEVKLSTPYKFAQGQPKVISTIPMPTLMQALNYPRMDKINFRYAAGVNVTAKVKDCDAFATINVPDPKVPYSRVSVTGDRLIVEFPNCYLNYSLEAQIEFKREAASAAFLLGIDASDLSELEIVTQRYHKIAPIDEGERKNFVHWASTTRGAAWQVGRFATWRPGLQLDSLIHDIRLVERWMTSSSSDADAEMHMRRSL
jgi:hypothetical protein